MIGRRGPQLFSLAVFLLTLLSILTSFPRSEHWLPHHSAVLLFVAPKQALTLMI